MTRRFAIFREEDDGLVYRIFPDNTFDTEEEAESFLISKMEFEDQLRKPGW